MGNHLFDLVSSLSEILAGIEMAGILCKVATDSGGHCKTKIGIDVDFANSHGRSFSEHFLRDADGVGHLSAELVDNGDVLLRNRGSTVKHDGKSGKKLGNLFENVETELGLLAGLEFICTVACADGNGK